MVHYVCSGESSLQESPSSAALHRAVELARTVETRAWFSLARTGSTSKSPACNLRLAGETRVHPNVSLVA